MADDPPIDVLKALAHPARFAILSALAGHERNVGEIEGATGIGQPGLSQQLSVLRQAGLVSSRREAKLVFYTLSHEVIRDTAKALAALLPGDGNDAPAQHGGKLTSAAMFAQLD
ncbi:MAG: helix-turn-helix transcriptional regulator [Sphingomonadales bacterium]|nr:helix-turn-helix transcriptional regulator [Sphingomonadales bacterium]MBD3772722.1 helix-turn-helix transcriptional regulator [Paracoccaceae bacterium]